MPDALPGTTLPIYPGLGQAPNMLACISDIKGSLDKGLLDDSHSTTHTNGIMAPWIRYCPVILLYQLKSMNYKFMTMTLQIRDHCIL